MKYISLIKTSYINYKSLGSVFGSWFFTLHRGRAGPTRLPWLAQAAIFRFGLDKWSEWSANGQRWMKLQIKSDHEPP